MAADEPVAVSPPETAAAPATEAPVTAAAEPVEAAEPEPAAAPAATAEAEEPAAEEPAEPGRRRCAARAARSDRCSLPPCGRRPQQPRPRRPTAAVDPPPPPADPGPRPAEARAAGEGETWRVVSAVNYRAGPDNDAERLGTIDAGRMVTVTGDTLGWKHVTLPNGDQGYIYKKWLELVTP